MEITRVLIKQRFDDMVTETTTYCPDEYSSIETAKNKLIDKTLSNLAEFEILTQEMIDDQSETHSEYLDGAKVGDLVLGHEDCWVSQYIVDGWRFESEKMIGKSFNCIRDIAEFIENDLALEVLSNHND